MPKVLVRIVKKRQWDSGSVWERNRHDNRCSLCSHPEPVYHVEWRRTGYAGKLQPWPYCISCWADYLAGELYHYQAPPSWQLHRSVDPHCIFSRD